ncbi:hypothetical protein D1007_12918 [Hordeum vulgare]|nr:hypothetical protein D1007_12918 [Hordeum vulgare]
MPEAAAVKSKAVATEPMLIPAGAVASVLAAATVSLQTMERDPIGTGVMTEEDREVGSESLRSGLVKVTHGTLTEDQISQQVRSLVSQSYHWAPVRLDDQVFRVEFPRREDLERLLKFGFSKVTGNKCMLEFNECKKRETKGLPLEKVWIRFSGVPKTLLNDFLIVWSLDTLLGKTNKVDMSFTRKNGIARLLVVVLDPKFLPDFVPWSYDGLHYDLDVEVEETP